MTPLFFQRQKEDEDKYGAWYANRRYFALYSHEMYHAIEQRKLGMVKYLSKYIPLMLKWGGRSKHPMEAPAYKIGDAIFAKLQTDQAEADLRVAQAKAENKSVDQVGIRFMRFCGKYDLNRISEQAQLYVEPFNARLQA